MKTSALIAALLLTTTAVRAADMVIPFGEVTIPEAASHDVLAWLDTQAISATEQVEMTDPDDGHIYYVSRSVVVAETPEVRLRCRSLTQPPRTIVPPSLTRAVVSSVR